MTADAQQSTGPRTFTRRQQLFVRYFTMILVDLTVLNLFDEYWDLVVIESFTISLLVAVLLQALLQTTFKIEHRIAAYFHARPGTLSRFLRILSAWAVLFGSKFVILEAIDIAFGDQVYFKGPYHGIVAFVIVIIVMLATELAVQRITRLLD